MPELVILETDGGSRGNPGNAGFGAVLIDPDSGRVVEEIAEGIGVASNNVAEYRGLIAGLAAAKAHGARRVDVRADSKLVIEQMSGRWKIKHPDMMKLARQAAALVRGFDDVSFTHIPRAENKRADALANKAMDQQERDGFAPHATVLDPPQTPGFDFPMPLFDEIVEEILQPQTEPELEPMPGPSLDGVRVLLVRHGQTALSVERRFSGEGGRDAELTDLGREQANAAARAIVNRYEIDHVISSPLARTRQTADPIADLTGQPVEIDDRWLEMTFGSWDGLTVDEVVAADPDRYRAWLDDPALDAPGGTSLIDVEHRVLRALGELRREPEGSTIVVVTHTTPIKAVVGNVLGTGLATRFALHLDPGSISEVVLYRDGPAVLHGFNLVPPAH